ncbi:MAG: carbohydrate ABC transporter permease [bacterium]
MATSAEIVWWQRKSIRQRIYKSFIYTLLAMGIFTFALPFFWMLTTSLKVDEQIFRLPPVLIPHPLDWKNYPEAFDIMPFWRYFANTMWIVFMTLTGALLSCPLVAYAFARLRWPGRDALFIVLLSTIMLPPQVTMVPLYIIFSKLGWVDTFKPLYIRAWFGLPFFIFLLRQFMLTIPDSLEDAAKIDGCSPYGIYWRIVLPLIKPALATVSIFVFLNTWNDFVLPLIYLQSPEKRTLALGLQVFRTEYDVDWAQLMAASTAMTLPIVLLFFAAQRYFISGIVLTGLKA